MPVNSNNAKSIEIFGIPGLPAYRNPQAPEENDYYVGLTFYLFQVLPNPLREFFFTDIIRRNPYDRLILVFR